MKFFRGQGCIACNGTGYLGRTGLFEMLDVSREVRKLILRNASAMEIQDKAIQEGMKTVRHAGNEKVLAGETTIEQVIAVSTEQHMPMNLEPRSALHVRTIYKQAFPFFPATHLLPIP